MKLQKYNCIKCGNQVEAPKGATVICTKCGRTMWLDIEFKNEELIREEMILNFNEQWKR